MGRPLVLSMGPDEAEVIAADLAVMVLHGATDPELVGALFDAAGDRLVDGVLAVLVAAVRMAAGPFGPEPADESPAPS